MGSPHSACALPPAAAIAISPEKPCTMLLQSLSLLPVRVAGDVFRKRFAEGYPVVFAREGQQALFDVMEPCGNMGL